MAPPRTDLYDSLGIERDATQEQVRKAYRRNALQTHPDRLPTDATEDDKKEASERFRNVNNAYEILSNEQNRELYNKHGVWPPPEPSREQPFAPDPFGQFPSFFPQRPPNRGESSYHRHPEFPPFFHERGFTGFERQTDFRYTDPFELFNTIFRDMNGMAGPQMHPFLPHDRRHSHRHHHHHHGQHPFPQAPSMFFDPFPRSPFGSPFDNDPFFSSHSMLGSSTFDPGNRGGDQERPRNFNSVSIMTQTINGVTHTVKKRVDSEGNEHETRTFPDGRKVRFINGVEQAPRHGEIDQRLNGQSSSHGPNLIEEDKKKWWRRRW